MLRRQENVQLLFNKGMFVARGWLVLQVGARTQVRLMKLKQAELDEGMQRQMDIPVFLTQIGERRFWQF